MRSFATWISRHRKFVVLTWIAVLIGTGIAAGAIGTDFNEDFKPPKSDSQQAYDMLAKNFPAQSGDTGQFVFSSEKGVKDPAVKAQIEAALAKIAKVKGVGTIVSPYSKEGAGQISPDGSTAFATINWSEFITQTNLKTHVDPVIKIVNDTRDESSGLRVECGGGPCQFASQSESGGAEVFGVIAAMLVLFIMFGTFTAMGMPIITAIIAVTSSISMIGVLSNLINTAEFATFLSVMIGLGVGIDYALFVVTRFRQNMRLGMGPTESVILSMDTSGRAVLFAGITVMIAILGLFLVGMNFLYGPALAASMTVLFTMIASLTLLPALLVTAGARINDPYFKTLLASIKTNAKGRGERSLPDTLVGWILLPFMALILLPLSLLLYSLVIWIPQKLLALVRLPVPHRSHGQLDDGENAHPRWHSWSSFVQRHPWPVAISTALILAVLAIPAFSMNLGVADSGTDPKDFTTRQAYDILAKGFGAGFNGPLQIVIDSSAGQDKIDQAYQQIKDDKGVAKAFPPTESPNGKIAMISVFPTTSPQSTHTNELVARIRADVAPINEAGGKAHVAGVTAIFDDFSTQISNKLPLFIGAVVLLSALLLMMVFRSIAIPIKAVVMNLLGIMAAFGVTVAIFQWGWGASLIGVDSTGPIIAFLPVMVFAIVFGLSMDYEVFLMSRVHEEWEKHHDAEEAVVEGVSATGGVITAAAIIMIALFASFAFFSNDLVTKLFGVALATTIFLDAFLIRSALVPAVMAILGKSAWYMPSWLGRVLPKLNVEPPQEFAGAQAGGGKLPEQQT